MVFPAIASEISECSARGRYHALARLVLKPLHDGKFGRDLLILVYNPVDCLPVFLVNGGRLTELGDHLLDALGLDFGMAD